MKLILIRSPQLLLYKMKSKKEDKNVTTDTITISYDITVSNGRIQYERKAAGKLILKHICMKTINSYCKKRLKGDRGGRVDDFGTQGVVNFRSL